jgi:hypothetical protein
VAIIVQLASPEVGVGFVLVVVGFVSEAAGFASEEDSDFDSLFGVSDEGLDDGFAPLLRKSVAYQPLPFSWKPAALNIFENVACPQLGHTVSVGSLSFCRNSC